MKENEIRSYFDSIAEDFDSYYESPRDVADRMTPRVRNTGSQFVLRNPIPAIRSHADCGCHYLHWNAADLRRLDPQCDPVSGCEIESKGPIDISA